LVIAVCANLLAIDRTPTLTTRSRQRSGSPPSALPMAVSSFDENGNANIRRLADKNTGKCAANTSAKLKLSIGHNRRRAVDIKPDYVNRRRLLRFQLRRVLKRKRRPLLEEIVRTSCRSPG
jgi:hypothetical protein